MGFPSLIFLFRFERKLIKMDDKENKELRRGNSRIWVALVLVAIGGGLLLEEMGLGLPPWLFTWQMLLIVIGVFMGFNHGFRGGGWAILILIGGIFLMDDILPGFSLRHAWPFVFIAVGLLILLQPRRHHHNWHWKDSEQKWKQKDYWKQYAEPASPNPEGGTKQTNSSDDYFESTSVFGGVKKVILSKNFSRGDITCFMGGCEIDLTQADIQGQASIDVTQIFGGTKLLVPSHWKIKTDMTALFGSIEDKRQGPGDPNSDKILKIQGTSIFGGIEIKSY
jgi:predicted membrane protein